MEIIITKGKKDQLEQIEKLYNAAAQALEQGLNYSGWKKGVYPTGEDALEAIKQNNLFVAWYGNEVVGSIILNHEYQKSYEQANWLFGGGYDEVHIIHTLLVHPNYCKLGIGKKLMVFAEEHARK